MKLLAACAVLALVAAPGAASAAPADAVDAFERRLADEHARRLAPLGPPRESRAARASALAQTARVLEEHNERHARGERGFFMAWNAMSDLSDDEYREFLRARPENQDESNPHYRGHGDRPIMADEDDGGRRRGRPAQRKKQVTVDFTTEVDEQETDASSSSSSSSSSYDDGLGENVTIPASLNWAALANGKYVTPIKNQGTCGSCWAFSGISALESRVAIALDVQAVPLSVEQVLGCSSALDHVRARYDSSMFSSSEGCAGGMPFLTYEYLSRVAPHGVACESSYPYVMATSSSSASTEDDGDSQCRSVPSAEVAVSWTANVSDYRVVRPNSEEALLRALLSGPVSANMDASGAGFRHYGGGVYDASDCLSDGKEVNHAVVIVGFGETSDGETYWVLRNTWGTMWGEDGYMRVRRGLEPHGPCNLYLYSTYPVNLTASANASSLDMCAARVETFEALAASQLLALGGLHWLMLLGVSVACLGAGVALLFGFEALANRREAAGGFSYSDSYKRWVLPTREQIAQVVEARRRSSEARRRRITGDQ